jgi:hypothetical protein
MLMRVYANGDELSSKLPAEIEKIVKGALGMAAR